MKTSISYVDYSFSPWWGCTAKCPYCFARQVAKRAGRDFSTLTPVKDATWRMPIKWNTIAAHENFRACENCGHREEYKRQPHTCTKCNTVTNGVRVKPRVLCGTMCDWLDEKSDADSFLRLVRTIYATPRLTWLMLTKNPHKLFSLAHSQSYKSFPDNVWFGITAENQMKFDSRWDCAVKLYAKKWVSIEPMDGFVTFMDHDIRPDWVVIGAKTGKFNECDAAVNENMRYLICECKAFNIPVFVKQVRVSGKILSSFDDMPEWARVRQFPDF